jgi:hypothetical protein
MQPLRGTPSTARVAMAKMAGNVPATYAQGGLTAVLLGLILGIVVDQLRGHFTATSQIFSRRDLPSGPSTSSATM